MKNKSIFVACDTSNLNEIKKIINQTNSDKLKIIPKFGLQFFYSKNGRKFLEKFKKDFWLDLKINDIPQTALSAIDSIKDFHIKLSESIGNKFKDDYHKEEVIEWPSDDYIKSKPVD